MPLSAADMEALLEAQENVRKIGQILPAEIRDTSPASVVGALLTVQLQHCDSIILLMMTGQNDASAEALLRPAIECFASGTHSGFAFRRPRRILQGCKSGKGDPSAGR